MRQQVDAADDRVAQFESELATARKEFADQEHQRGVAEAARKDAMAKEEKAVEKLNELRLDLATEQQRHDNLIAQQQPMSARDAELNETIETRRAEITSFKNRLASQATESNAAEAGIDEQKKLQEQRKAEVAALCRPNAASICRS